PATLRPRPAPPPHNGWKADRGEKAAHHVPTSPAAKPTPPKQQRPHQVTEGTRHTGTAVPSFIDQADQLPTRSTTSVTRRLAMPESPQALGATMRFAASP